MTLGQVSPARVVRRAALGAAGLDAHPRARSCRNAITMASVMIDEIRLRAHARPSTTTTGSPAGATCRATSVEQRRIREATVHAPPGGPDGVDTLSERPSVDGQMTTPAREQMRARYPDECGYANRDGVRVYYEAYGKGEPTILFLPTWEIVHSRTWKFQIPYFSRHGRVVTFDRRGNGRSDCPLDVGAYDRRAAVGDALAVLDKAGAQRVVVVSWCGAGDDLILAVEHAERVAGLVLIAPDLLLTDDPADEEGPYPFDEEPVMPEGWAKWNRHYFLRDWPGFLEFFFTQTFTEPHSTKQTEDAIGWGLQTDPQTIVRGLDAEWINDRDSVTRLGAQVPCPTLVIQGSQDAVVGPARGAAVADAIPHAQLITLEGCGHAPHLRDPVITNLLIRDFVSLVGTAPSPAPRSGAL
jgi:pimeloyl-ACP methyl ester carboxylesterase